METWVVVLIVAIVGALAYFIIQDWYQNAIQGLTFFQYLGGSKTKG